MRHIKPSIIAATYILTLVIGQHLAPIIGSAFAAALTTTPQSLAAADKSTLRGQLAAADTSATLEPLDKWINGVETEGCFDTTAGFVIIQDETGRTEWASFGSKSCNSTTHVTTLSDMRRGLDPRSPSFSAGTGMDFDAGAVVQVIDWPTLYNYSAYIDKVNTLTGSGQITSNQTNQAAFDMNCVTTAQRDAFTNVSDGNMVCNSTTGNMNVRLGGAWLALATATGSFVNATTSVAGKVEIATDAEILARTSTGSTAATVVVPASATAINTKNQWGSNTGTTLTLNTDGNVTVTYPYHTIVANSGTSDYIEKILTTGGPGTSTGQIIMIRSSGSQILNIKNGSGNLLLGRDFTMTNSGFILTLRYDGQNWRSMTDLGPPVGEMKMVLSDTPPNGYLLMYGQAVSRTTYGNLFSAFGTNFGVGDGSTTFNLPDMRGRFPLGQDDMGGSSANRVTDTRADTIGSSSGSELTTLGTGNLPPLYIEADPNGSGAGSSYNVLGEFGAGGTFELRDRNSRLQVPVQDTNSNVLGSNNPFTNLGPYLTINYMVKY